MIEEKYMNIMNEIRSIYQKNGSQLFHSVEEFGDHMNPYYPSKDGKNHIVMYYTSVHNLITPEGSHTVLGSRVCGNDDQAAEEVITRFGLIKEREWGYGGERFISYLITKE
jgi:hypothetical protein